MKEAGVMQTFLGLDLGQRADYSALIGLERVVRRERARNLVTYGWDIREERWLGLVMAERIPLGTPYPVVVKRAAEAAKECAGMGKCSLAVNVTGVGAAVWDLLREQDVGKCRLLPVVMTSGLREHWSEGRHCVPKADLVAGVVRVMEEGLLFVADGVELETLVREMREFGVTISGRGREGFEGKKDDLVMALSLAVWAAGKAGVGEPDLVIPGTLRELPPPRSRASLQACLLLAVEPPHSQHSVSCACPKLSLPSIRSRAIGIRALPSALSGVPKTPVCGTVPT
jgi:hypothetical protein